MIDNNIRDCLPFTGAKEILKRSLCAKVGYSSSYTSISLLHHCNESNIPLYCTCTGYQNERKRKLQYTFIRRDFHLFFFPPAIIASLFTCIRACSVDAVCVLAFASLIAVNPFHHRH